MIWGWVGEGNDVDVYIMIYWIQTLIYSLYTLTNNTAAMHHKIYPWLVCC